MPNIFVQFLARFGVSVKIFVKFPISNLAKNPSSGSPTDTCGQTDRRTDVRKVFAIYANAPKNHTDRTNKSYGQTAELLRKQHVVSQCVFASGL